MNRPLPFAEPPGATPLDAEDYEGLIPTWIATRGDLNAAEQDNIGKAIAWSNSRYGPGSIGVLLTEESMRGLHARMFGEVWRWAGTYRHRDTNIGVAWPNISVQVRHLLADVLAQTADQSRLPWPVDEVAIRFHHRLTVIHPFPNGNGRHARLAADLLVTTLGGLVFSWGAQDLGQRGAARGAYIDALRQADTRSDFEPLMTFARS